MIIIKIWIINFQNIQKKQNWNIRNKIVCYKLYFWAILILFKWDYIRSFERKY